MGLFFFPFVSALWMAVLLLWLLDASNNTAMEPYRAFLADKLTDSQLAKGFLTQSFFTGLGNSRSSGPSRGSVPGDIAHRAPCDVLIVQTEQVARDDQLSA